MSFKKKMATLFDNIKYKKNMIITGLAICIILLLVFSNDSSSSFKFSTDSHITNILIIIAVSVFMILFLGLKTYALSADLGEDEMTVKNSIYGFVFNKQRYSYKDIYRVIVGRFFYGQKFDGKNIYTFYIDWNNDIKKISNINNIKRCLDFMDEIKLKSKLSIFDNTDEIYYLEDDLIRSYYKTKKLVNEIKNEK